MERHTRSRGGYDHREASSELAAQATSVLLGVGRHSERAASAVVCVGSGGEERFTADIDAKE